MKAKKKKYSKLKFLQKIQQGKIDRGTIFVVVIVISLMFSGYLFVGGTIPETIPQPRAEGIVSIDKDKKFTREEGLQMHTFYGVTNTPYPTQGDLKPLPETGSPKLTILFDFDKDIIKPEFQSQIDAQIDAMKALTGDKKIRVEGHTDTVSDSTYNMTLSQRRSDTVKKYLVSKGIATDKIVSTGRGETSQLDTPEKSRRVEVFF